MMEELAKKNAHKVTSNIFGGFWHSDVTDEPHTAQT